MEQLQPAKTKYPRLKRFFYETFRPHSKAEYAEFFTRGIKKEESDGMYKAYPFVYARVFVILSLLFGLTAEVLFITENTISFPVVTLFGGLLLNLPLVVLAYELYPMKNISLPFMAAVVLFGGIASTVLIDLAYMFYEPADEIADAFYVGFVEEFFKALPCLIIIRYSKNKTPFFGILVGIAVGAGMATGEDMGYIFIFSNLGYYVNYYELASIAVVRAVTAVCTHIVWTGLIGYAFAKYQRPLSEPRFYVMFGGCVLLHALWDMPVEVLGYELLALDYFVCATVAMTLIIRAVTRERRLIKEALCPEILYNDFTDMLSEAAATNLQEEKPVQKKLMFANAIMGICTFVIAVCGTLICYLGDEWFVYEQKTFASSTEMLGYVQSGIYFEIDTEREYSGVPDSGSATGGKLAYATQCVSVPGNYDVYYEYSFEYGITGAVSTLENIWVSYNGFDYYMGTLVTENEEIPYFLINSAVQDVYYRDGRFIVETTEVLFTGTAELLALLLSSLVALVGVASGAAILIKEKKRQEQNARAAEIFDFDREN